MILSNHSATGLSWETLLTYEASPNEGSVTSPNSLKINWIGASGVFWIRQTIPLEGGKTYRFKFQYKVDLPSRDEAFITLTIAGTPKAVLGATNQWQWAESWDASVGGFDTPEIEVTCFLAGSPPEATEVFYFDSFRVWEVGSV
ncbi:hypothetical protein H072_9746 [Dactylellina haptotyla CBS 200.50]|uniref:CBM-cenC domain-containing protein n=1 Tax=Dactylellina haptotyla (strain CBS 200.50) TaxID=1284197 RepID=S8A107_DACHA|nr:hypothetical protein H072_9746 [Dactylellina haptotyla CBS 200.50]